MKRTITILGLMVLFMILPTMAEQQTLGTFQQDECVDLIQTCADCSYVNFTSVKYPDSSLALGNVQATKQGTEYNYTFCNTDKLGTYIVNGVGDVGGTDTVFAYNFEITKSGNENNGMFNITVFSVILGIWLIFTYLMHRWKEDEGASITYGTLATVFIAIMGAIILSGFEIILTNLTIIFNINYYIAAICFVMALYSGAYSFFLWDAAKHRTRQYYEK